jgi:LacI family transcriptional regulator
LGYISQKQSIANKIQIKPVAEIDDEKKTVLILMPNVRFQTKNSVYWGKIVDGITEGIKQAGLGVVILTENSAENFSNIINPKAFIGIIGVGMIPTNLLLEVNNFKLPIILIDHEDPLIPTDTIFTSNMDSMFSITNHLIGQGHKNICFVGNNDWSRSFSDRWLGFRAALETNELFRSKEDHYIEVNGKDNVEMEEEICRWLKAKKEQIPTALVCANDPIAMSTVTGLKKQLDIKVPRDISVTGFDNTDESYLSTPTITTVNVPKEDIGLRSVEMLLRRIKKQQAPFEKVMIICPIIFRESVSTPNQKTATQENQVT